MQILKFALRVYDASIESFYPNKEFAMTVDFPKDFVEFPVLQEIGLVNLKRDICRG